LRASAEAGRSVLVTSSEPEELVQIAHRVIVLSGGRIAATLAAQEIEEGRLLSLAHQIERRGQAA
jgi:ribose transport system ATP-binding protein